MRTLFQILVILIVLLGFGAAKLGFEDRLNQDMVNQKLLQPPLKEGTSLQLGQTGAAVALGGLRSLVASIWNFRAYLHFEDLNWIKVEESYEIITTLQPQTTHYWNTGAWHLHTNASGYYRDNEDITPFRRASMRSLYINKGAAFLEEGVRQNPDNWKLHYELARMWSDHHKIPDLERAVQHFTNTLKCETLPEYKRSQMRRFMFYNMTRVEGREQEAYDLGRGLFDESPDNHLPKLVCGLFALQNSLNIPETARIPDLKLFPSEALQLTWLKVYLNHENQDYPMDGVRAKINELEARLLFQ